MGCGSQLPAGYISYGRGFSGHTDEPEGSLEVVMLLEKLQLDSSLCPSLISTLCCVHGTDE